MAAPGEPSAPVVVVVGGGGPPSIRGSDLGDLGDAPVVIAADSGLEHAATLGLAVDRVVGDMDSVDLDVLDRAIAAGTEVDRHPEAKDATDLDLALDAAFALGPSRLVVVTGVGDRFDHALALALGLSAPQRPPVPTEAWLGPAHLWVVRGRSLLAGTPGDHLSLLPVHGTAQGVTTGGLLYPLDDEDLDVGTSRGVSNEWSAPVATVSVRGGVLLAVAPGSPGSHWARSSG